MGEYSQHGYELSISVAVLLFQGGNKSESGEDLRKKKVHGCQNLPSCAQKWAEV